MTVIPLATIGFTQSTAEHFFTRLKGAGVKKVIDVRLHHSSQLAGFAKSSDLAWFLDAIGGIAYEQQPLFVPTEEIMVALRKPKGDWRKTSAAFLDLLAGRRVEDQVNPESLDRACLLCAEALPHHCHRQLVCDYLNGKWHGALEVSHL